MNLISIEKIVIIGTGRVATQLGSAFHNAGFSVAQVYGRNPRAAAMLAAKLDCPYTSDLGMIYHDADLYLLAVADDAISHISGELNQIRGLLVHTSGFQPVSAIHQEISRKGVFYPLQTFSFDRNPVFSEIPFFVEADNEADTQLLEQLAFKLSSTVVRSTSQQRQQLHLAAVFVCNFSNAMYDMGHELIKSNQLNFDLLKPLIRETAEKALQMDPSLAQTGPARRNDNNVLMAHRQILQQYPQLSSVYASVTDYILNKYHNTGYEQL